MIFINWDIEDFGYELNLFLRRLVQSDQPVESIEMIVSKRFLWERWSCFHGDSHPYIVVIVILIDSVNISCNKLKFCINIFLTTIVIDCNPTPNISISLFLVDSQRVVCLPTKASCSIRNFTWSCKSFLTENFPVESWSSEESFRKSRELNSSYFVKNLNSICSLNNVAWIVS